MYELQQHEVEHLTSTIAGMKETLKSQIVSEGTKREAATQEHLKKQNETQQKMVALQSEVCSTFTLILLRLACTSSSPIPPPTGIHRVPSP